MCLLTFFDNKCVNVELYEILNLMKITEANVSVFDNGKNDEMNISTFCESCKIELMKTNFILYLTEINNMFVFKKNENGIF